MSRILVADDNEQNRYLLDALFSGHAHQVAQARNGAEAWELAQASPPDLIVSDLLMPELDGFELCRRCKSDARLSSVPFLVYTATYTDPKDECLVLSLGADRVLVKPQIPTTLLQVVDELLRAADRGLPTRVPEGSERDHLLGHNEALVRKLEAKVQQLQEEMRLRKEAEAALRESESRFRLLAENAEDVVWAMGFDGRFTYVSPSVERQTGYSSEEVRELTLEARVPATGAAMVRRDLEAAGAEVAATGDTQRTGTWEMEITRRDGSTAWVETCFSPLRDDAGRPIGLQGVTRDTTQRRLVQQRLAISQRLESIGRLAGGVAHDFNNILACVLSYAGFALERLAEDDPNREDIEQIRIAAERGAALTRQLLAFSRRQPVDTRVLNLNTVVLGMTPMLQRLIGGSIEIETALADDLGNVRADSGQLEQILMNLTVNARDAMPGGGRILVKTRNAEVTELDGLTGLSLTPGRYVVLSVSDTGAGMDAATMAQIFEPFFTTKAFSRGTGLGLSIVHGVVQQSHGDVRVRSALGEGTCFEIFLPRVEAAEQAAFSNCATTAAPGGEHVLVVDEDAVLRRIVVRMLRNANYRVEAVSDAEEAERVAQQGGGRFDLLVTDLALPGRSGPQLARSLMERFPSMRVLYMSGVSDAPSPAPADNSPRPLIIGKPFSASELALRVRQALTAEPGRETHS